MDLQAGLVGQWDEAFQKWLFDGHPWYIDLEKRLMAIEYLRQNSFDAGCTYLAKDLP